MRVSLPAAILLVLSACGGDDDAARPAAPSQSDAAPVAEQAGAGSGGNGGGAQAAPEEPQVADVMAPRLPVTEQVIAYGEAEDRNLTGFLALPADSFEPPPGVLVIHEWLGLNEDMRALARRLAGEGFVVLAIDLYAEEVATSTAQAQGLMTRVMTDPEAALDNISQGIEYLRRYALAPRVATYGQSFGGTWSLQAGVSFAEDVDAVVTWYGQIIADEVEIERLQSPIMGIYAGEDESIPADSVVQFRSALNRAGQQADIRIYPDARHDFARPSSDSWRMDDAEDAWQRVIAFLNEQLR